ncbi:PBSX family phage terminase large subunit [Allonocardiopsis opalescens]|uniref:PBSX family phage terminase large subunit n=2 Tax=Allonocardiopsis opalescens TaxID=1144618 RepID=A0A2T0PSV5_9ACTN|nr:PBSX family phage terminase large subunit [Allonocardiopsis opalescens]
MSPAQIRSIVDSLSTPQIALWCGAVSSGKTIASLLAFLIAITQAPDRGLIVIVGRTLQTIERNILDPLQSVELFGVVALQVHHTTGSTTAVILGRTVHLVGASDARAESRIRGATIALAYCDEATLVPQSFWMMLLSRLRVPGAKLLATTNPDSRSHWLRKEFILRAGEVGLRHFHFTIDDNPSLDPTYVELLNAQYTGLWYRRFILGEWSLAAGAVFDMWDEQRHVVDDLPGMTRWLALGVDYGTTNPFAALLLGLGSDGCLYLASEWRWDSKAESRQLTDMEYSQRVRAWLQTVPIPGAPGVVGPVPEWWVVDPSAASFRVQLHRDGISARLGDNEVIPGLRVFASLLASGQLKVHRSCAGLIDEVAGYSWDTAKAERGEDAPVKVDDHSLDAARYAIYTTRSLWLRQLRDPKLAAA